VLHRSLNYQSDTGRERPAFCGRLQPSEEMCGANREQAIRWLDDLERATRPD
jgi:hypothetical protein